MYQSNTTTGGANMHADGFTSLLIEGGGGGNHHLNPGHASHSSNTVADNITPNKRSLMQKNSISNLMGSMSKMHDKSGGGGSNMRLPRASVRVENITPHKINASPYSILDPTAYLGGNAPSSMPVPTRKQQA
jgi:hypothetical protein